MYAKEITQNLTNEKDLPITNIELHNCEEDGDKQKYFYFMFPFIQSVHQSAIFYGEKYYRKIYLFL